ncbi:hypothetical protein BDV06DRAFT_210520 [Aspergillus oleicola]
MPSSSVTVGWTFANWGPAPATFTSSSCTPSPVIYLAESEDPDLPEEFESCPATTYDSCYPEPTNSDLIDDFLNNQRNIPFWSPGVNCPSGWESVGRASRSGDADVESTGIFTVNAIPTSGIDIFDDLPGDLDDDVRALGYHDAFAALLEPSETAIACCPSSMTVGRNGICYSTLSSASISTACEAAFADVNWDLDLTSTTFVWHGSTRTGFYPTTTIPRTPTRTATHTIDDDDQRDLVAATQLGPIYLVHRPGDEDEFGSNGTSTNTSSSNGTSTETGTGSNSDSSGSGNGTNSDSESADETGAASRLTLGQGGDWAQVKAMLGVLGMSLLMGMGLIVW